MESLYLLIPIGIVFVVIAVKILFWAINSGQYDNLDTEAHRILFDEQVPPVDEQSPSKNHRDVSAQHGPAGPETNRPETTRPETTRLETTRPETKSRDASAPEKGSER